MSLTIDDELRQNFGPASGGDPQLGRSLERVIELPLRVTTSVPRANGLSDDVRQEPPLAGIRAPRADHMPRHVEDLIERAVPARVNHFALLPLDVENDPRLVRSFGAVVFDRSNLPAEHVE